MRLGIQSTLLYANVALMACSLSAVSAVVLLRHLAVVRTVADREIEQVANDVEHRVSRFLENGPAVLNRVKYFVEHQDAVPGDIGRVTDYLASEARASPTLTWVSVSSAGTGEFLGVTRRDGTFVLNRSDPTVDGGIAREWELRPDGTRVPLETGPGVPYDPRGKAWFALGIDADEPRWTDAYEFAEGRPGISAVVGLRHPGTGRAAGVATADFHLSGIESFLADLRVGTGGRAVILAPGSAAGSPEESLVLGAGSGFPEELRAALTAVAGQGAGEADPPRQSADRSGGRFRATAGGVIVDGRTLAVGGGLHWQLLVMLPLADVEAPMWSVTAAVLVTACLFLAVGIVAATVIACAISRPIRLMSRDLAAIGDLHFARTRPVRSSIREIDAMACSLVRMKAALRSFSTYVPVDVVRRVLTSGQAAEPGGELRVLTVLVSDLAGFTGIAEGMPPGKLVGYLGRYFGILERAVHDAGGIVDKFVGDGMLAFFDAPARVGGHAAQACEAALDAQRSLGRLAKVAGDAPPHTRIGLAAGEVLVGNIGTAQRLSYTVIGDAVNLASRLEMLNKAYGTAILASGEVRRVAGSGFEWRHLDRVTVPGRSEPVELYELLGRKGEVAATALLVRDLHEAALGDLVAGRFDEAARGFRALLGKAPDDRPARYLLEHTVRMGAELAVSGPSRDWRGVHVHRSKM
ncbi:hypothetical protein JL101_033190 (plasmid) [Skermanella rosea]|uniref:adenylate/guanylate cyclase domain-containing protein n=1 Tax=Skermanella rosea TaxID=1817965 RepID=UPI0019330805|nr:adenylate/guanylate cyclase domain-containing protein [Skermanella rosea]UEM07338.1 hypothetical protein JL101_033190 [Skermanella rosea]